VTDQPAAPAVVRARPIRLRRICVVVAGVVFVLFVLGAVLLPAGSTGARFGRGDQWALVGIGVLAAAGVLRIGRVAVQADATGLRVRNVLGSHEVPWDVVRGVSFEDGSPWASLDLLDDEAVALMAVQAADGERAVQVVRALRALHERYGPASPG
jgi:hypothetical protein